MDTDDIKFNCPHCGQAVVCDIGGAGASQVLRRLRHHRLITLTELVLLFDHRPMIRMLLPLVCCLIGVPFAICGQTNQSSSEALEKQFATLESILLVGPPPALITAPIKQRLVEKNPALAELYEARLEEAAARKQLAAFGFSPPFDLEKRSAEATNKPGYAVTAITGNPRFEIDCMWRISQRNPIQPLTPQQQAALKRADPDFEKIYASALAIQQVQERYAQTHKQLETLPKPKPVLYRYEHGTYTGMGPIDPRYSATSKQQSLQFGELQKLSANHRKLSGEFFRLRGHQWKRFREDEKKRHSKAAVAAWDALERAGARVERAKIPVIENKKKSARP